MKKREAAISRETRETNIGVTLKLDESGPSIIETGIGFFDHMLTLLAHHADGPGRQGGERQRGRRPAY